jgi:hypothetical protein
MDQGLKDVLQLLTWVVAAGALILAIYKFRSELHEGRLQRERDLRWRQAEVGKSLNDEMQTDERAWPALQMLDSERREFKLPNEKVLTVDRSDVAPALDPQNDHRDEKSVYIQDCFDTLFYFMAMLEHYISNTLIREDDVAYPMEYYVPLMSKMRPQVAAYLERHGLRRAQRFLERYPAWREAADATEYAKRLSEPLS